MRPIFVDITEVLENMYILHSLGAFNSIIQIYIFTHFGGIFLFVISSDVKICHYDFEFISLLHEVLIIFALYILKLCY